MKRVIKPTILILAIIIIAIAIYINYKNVKNNQVEIMINNQKIIFSKQDSSKTKDLDTLNSEFETIVTNLSKLGKVKINGIEIKHGENISLGKLKISEESKINVDIRFYGDREYTKYEINTIPTKFAKYTVEG